MRGRQPPQSSRASHADERSSRHRRREVVDRDEERGRREKKKTSYSSLQRCLRNLRRRHCYVALLIGSVLANVVQLVAFFSSRPINGGQRATLRERARSSFRVLLGAISTFGEAPHASTRVETDEQPARASVAPSSNDAARATADAGSFGAYRAPSSLPRVGDGGVVTVPLDDSLTPPSPPSPAPPSPAASAVPLPERHPQYRIALTVPWIGKTFPSWFPYFLSSCRRSHFLADWLIFHEGARMPDADEIPPNVLFHDVGKDGLGRLFGTRLSEALGIYDATLQHRMVQLFQIAFREFAYIVTECALPPRHSARRMRHAR
jgi:hypothetical protein